MNLKNYLLNSYIEQNGETITATLARDIVLELPITDGSNRTSGEQFTEKETAEIMAQMKIDDGKIKASEFYLIINKLYSLYAPVLSSHNLTGWVIYAELARAWFDDLDADEHKAFNYFCYC